MINAGAYEVSESVYEIDDGDIDRVIREMETQGFLLVKNEEFSDKVSDSISGNKQKKGRRSMTKAEKSTGPCFLGGLPAVGLRLRCPADGI